MNGKGTKGPKGHGTKQEPKLPRDQRQGTKGRREQCVKRPKRHGTIFPGRVFSLKSNTSIGVLLNHKYNDDKKILMYRSLPLSLRTLLHRLFPIRASPMLFGPRVTEVFTCCALERTSPLAMKFRFRIYKKASCCIVPRFEKKLLRTCPLPWAPLNESLIK